MGNHHDSHHSNEQKPVSFTVPFILATVTLVAILLLVSLDDPGHGKCECKEDCSKECMEACEKGEHSMHPEKAAHGHEATTTEEKPAATEAAHATEAPADSTHSH